MASLQKIKSRMHTVESIRKITHAMELVSTSKIRRARECFDAVSLYESQVTEVFDIYFHSVDAGEILDFIKRKFSKRKLFIVIATDLGLAGSYNSNIIKLCKSKIGHDDEVILLGTKGISSLSHIYKSQIILQRGWGVQKAKKIAKQLTKLAFDRYINGHVGEINVIYTNFINNLVQQETCFKILPYQSGRDKIKTTNAKQVVEFEPNALQILKDTMPIFVNAKINLALASASLSEYAARRAAMESATQNANDLIKNLNLDYNRKRQSNITQELNEIVSGANAV